MLKPIESYLKILKPDQINKFMKWANINNIDKWEDSHKAWYKISQKTRNYEDRNDYIYADHLNIFRKKDGSKIWIIQPYHSAETIKNSNIDEWCAERGLKYTIDEDNSWHFAGTILVQFEIDNEEVLNKYINK